MWLILLWMVCAVPVYAVGFSYENEYETEPERESSIIESSDLARDSALARSQGLPLLLEFSTPWCSYCAALEENVLEPLQRSREFAGLMVLRKLEITSYTKVRDVDGRILRSDALARKYRVALYPTLLLFDTRGRELMRIVGITTHDYVNAELERALLQQRATAGN